VKLLSHLQTRIFDTPLAIHPDKLDIILRTIGPRIGLELRTEQPGQLQAQYEPEPASRRCCQVTEDGIALIPVQGTLMKKSAGLWAMSGCSSYERIAEQVRQAYADSQIRGVLLDIDSPGGETHGMFDLSDLIYSWRGQKPCYAIANDAALSAAYVIASAADRIFVTRTGAVGSIGVFALHLDQSGADEQAGLKYTYIYAGDKKTDGNPHEPLSKTARSDAQAEVDREYQMFVSTVARNRGQRTERIAATEAAVLYAGQAVPLLADEVGTLDDALQALRAQIEAPVLKGESAIAPHKNATGRPVEHRDSVAAINAEPIRKEKTMRVSEWLALAAKKAEEAEEARERAKKARKRADEAEETAKKARKKADEAEESEDAEDARKNADEAEAEAKRLGEEADEAEEAAADAEADARKARKKTGMKQDEEDEEEEDGDGERGKKAASTSLRPDASEARQIAKICALAGKPELAAEYIGKGMTLAEALADLQDKRSAESSGRQVDPNFGAVNTSALDKILSGAQSLAANGKMPSAEAYAQVLRAHPHLYEAYLEERDSAMLTQASRRMYVQHLQARLSGSEMILSSNRL